ncbi:MAG: RNA 2'-phosphotransferase [Candidatus Bathyarchaeales archaeon]
MSICMKDELKVKVSRYMSYLLRHNPENLKMDRHGFISLDELLEKIKERFQVDKKFIFEIVKKSDRKRFEIVEGKIRALYGHTIPVKLKICNLSLEDSAHVYFILKVEEDLRNCYRFCSNLQAIA